MYKHTHTHTNLRPIWIRLPRFTWLHCVWSCFRTAAEKTSLDQHGGNLLVKLL